MIKSLSSGPFGRLRLIAAIITMTAARAGAFSFEPMVVTFEPKGPNAIKTYRVSNESDQVSIAVKISVTTRAIDENGNETNVDASSYFTIFPSRFVLDKGATRALKVQYKGPDPGKAEQSYRIIAEQLPVEFANQSASGISILLRYLGAVYIRNPSTTAPNIKAIAAAAATRNDQRGILVTVRNDGGTHAIIKETKLELAAANGRRFWLEGETMAPLNGINVLAGNSRIVFIPSDAVEDLQYEPRLEYKVEQ